MSGLLTFQERYRDEESCILALADRRWPSGFACARCGHRRGYRHKARARVFECAACGRQDGLAPATVAQMVPGGVVDGAGQAVCLARELGLRDRMADGSQAAPWLGGARCVATWSRSLLGAAMANRLLVLAVEKVAVAPGKGVKGNPAPGCRAARRLRAGRLTPGARLLPRCRARRSTSTSPPSKAKARTPRRRCRSATSRPGSTATMASAPSTCRAMAGNGPSFNRRRRIDDSPEPRHGPANHHIPPVIHGLQPQGARPP